MFPPPLPPHLSPLLLIRQSLKASIIISVTVRYARSDISSAFPLSAVARATKDAIIAKPCMRSNPIVFACVSRTNDYVRNCGGYCCERRLISAVVWMTGRALIFRVECGEFNFRSLRKIVSALRWLTTFLLSRVMAQFVKVRTISIYSFLCRGWF